MFISCTEHRVWLCEEMILGGLGLEAFFTTPLPGILSLPFHLLPLFLPLSFSGFGMSFVHCQGSTTKLCPQAQKRHPAPWYLPSGAALILNQSIQQLDFKLSFEPSSMSGRVQPIKIPRLVSITYAPAPWTWPRCLLMVYGSPGPNVLSHLSCLLATLLSNFLAQWAQVAFLEQLPPVIILVEGEQV